MGAILPVPNKIREYYLMQPTMGAALRMYVLERLKAFIEKGEGISGEMEKVIFWIYV